MAAPEIPGKGLFIGLAITGKTLLKTLFPDGPLKPIPSPSKGAVTCVRECPDWCIYIEAHKTKAPPRREGGKPRKVNELDRFDIDYALCMYCGICVEVCPFEALFWSPEFEYSEPHIADLLHDKTRLGQWFETVPEFEAYEAGSQAKVKKVPR
jgi:NADH-quinone oxidoreductase subunit I